MKKEKKRDAAELQLHSDQSFQYTSHGYFKLSQSYGITRHNAVDVKKSKSLQQRNGRKFLFYSENRMYLSAQTKYIQGSR